MKGLIATGLLVAVLAGVFFFSWMGKNDHEVVLKQGVVSQQDVCTAKFDEMFKSIKQTAQVPDKFIERSEEAFKKIYTPLIEGRYQNNDGEQQAVMMKWVQESNPDFDLNAFSGMYEKIQQIIEIKRTEFFTEQKKLISRHQEHTIFVSTFMNKNLFMLGEREIGYCSGNVDKTDPDYVFCLQIITSANTDNAYKTGQENDISVF